MSQMEEEEEVKQVEEVENNPQEQENECYASYEEYFLDCCRSNDLEEAQDCINQKCDITWYNNGLNNGLHMACANGHIQILQLIKENLDKWGNDTEEKKVKFINQKNCDQNTPLHWAAINGQKECIDYMIQMLKADANITNAMKKTPFDEAVLFNHQESAHSFINKIKEILAKVTKEDMSLYEGVEDYSAGGEDAEKEETMSNS